jgi:membrane fusion protein (multidrug efflux system)
MNAISASRDVGGGDVLAAPARRRLAVSKRQLAALAATLMAAPGAGYLFHQWWNFGRFIETTDDAYVGGDVTTIAPHVAGFVTDILVADNAHVAAGQLLARVDARDYQAAFDRARAAVAAQQASWQGLRAQRTLQQSIIAQAGADFDAKAAQSEFARIDGARYAALAVTRSGSVQDAQRARAADRQAVAAVAASQSAWVAARQKIDVLDAQIAQAQAAVAQAEADLQRARLDLGYTEIRSPIEGYVGNRAARVGNFVSAGAYLLSIIPAQGLWVDANFKEDQVALMRPGQAATLTADAAPGRTFHGTVQSLAPGTGAVFSIIPPENATGNFTKIVQRVPVRIELNGTDGTLSALRPGLSALVSVDTNSAR